MGKNKESITINILKLIVGIIIAIPLTIYVLIMRSWEIITFNDYCKKHSTGWIKMKVQGYSENGVDKLYCSECEKNE